MPPTLLLVAAMLVAASPRAKAPDPRALVGHRLPEPGQGEWASWSQQDRWEITADWPGAAPYEWVIWTGGRRAAVLLVSRQRVADVVRVELPRGWTLGFVCTPAAAARPDPEVVALVSDPPLRAGERCAFSRARKAWRLDRSRARIASMRPAGLRCQRSCPWD